ncbi:hypothetical protein E2C01_041399 [Portunus trituberculatus]|uniref:Uncharacterized protein n=1 Tax=Portunus trituberculatus TaxID=210409 RepID=A0A5B7FQM9_PORTR|nr:hypothetical protein [Portunus trituberculatus]
MSSCRKKEIQKQERSSRVYQRKVLVIYLLHYRVGQNRGERKKKALCNEATGGEQACS